MLSVQRVDVLVKQNKYSEALALALSFYDSRAKAVIGLSGSSKNKKDIISGMVRTVERLNVNQLIYEWKSYNIHKQILNVQCFIFQLRRIA